jgi:hypothetical protein
MLVRKTASAVKEGQTFHHAGRVYVLATEDQRRKHPGYGRPVVLAYHVVSERVKVAVTFNPAELVFIQK